MMCLARGLCVRRTSWHSFLKLHSLNLGARARAGVIIFTPSSARCDTRLQALDGPSHATEPTRVRCVRHDTARPRDSWPVSPLCVSVACGCVSLALLTFLQPRMRNHTCANRRSVVAASDETPVSHVTPPAPLARVRTSRREAPHAPLRPAWPVSRRATLWHALAYLSALAARQAPRAAPRAAQRSMKPAAVLNVAIEHGKQLATRALEPRRAPPIELPPAAKTSCAFAPPLGRATFFTTATAAAQACATRRAVSPTLPAEKPRVGKASAALPRDGREP